MKYNYPHKIENGSGEEITFIKLVQDSDGGYLEIENTVSPGSGPPIHTHFKQDESLTVIKGRLAAEMPGEEIKYYGEGESATFKAGCPHRFWNAGNEPLLCKGWIKPAHNIEYFLTQIYDSTKANGGKRPGNFDSAYLLKRYASEFDMQGIPPFVKKVIFPLTVFFGKLSGKDKKFKDAPEPVK